jgi:cytochrome c5
LRKSFENCHKFQIISAFRKPEIHFGPLAIYAIILVSILSCGTDHPVTQDEESPPTYEVPNEKAIYPATSSECENGTSLTWGSFGNGFFEKYCTSCHSSSLDSSRRGGAPLNSNFDNYGSILASRSKILINVGKIAGAKMPPSDIVPLDERKAIIEYLKCGAPE